MDTTYRPLVTLVVPAYNEASILQANMEIILEYLRTLESRYRFEVLIVNDGSTDGTGIVADRLSELHPSIQVVHHPSNFGLGQSCKTAFAMSNGDYVVTMDADLSYAPDTIGALLDAMQTKRAKLVIASAYMKGGKVTKVPWLRLQLSRLGNRMIGMLTGNVLSTFTCMVRAFDGPFIRSLEPKHQGMGIMPELIYKTMVLGGKIVEIPAHLDWTRQIEQQGKRSSSMRLLSHIMSTFVSGFFFRPFMMLLVPGCLLLVFAAYVNTWVLIEFSALLQPAGGRLSEAAALLFRDHPATLLIGLLSLVLAVQMISLGGISLQSKRYFEETYFQLVKLRRQIAKAGQTGNPNPMTKRSEPVPTERAAHDSIETHL